ncbi:hypothetical protein CAEBREN_30606 [Caenorhabditis brenneri]|uniref:N-acetyltransferase domain-containing protein n=1 Tax=Caenorhabditis brenneri TaxID=135651 RepID=G0N2U9_CAEBE|nr:hypothetical protein CAEBREN_30606 [Caenorhabditis brenneri]
MAFLLVDSEKDEVIGHAKLCLLPNRPTSLFVETVLIAKDRRRLGLGRYLMMGVENWMRSNGFDRAFLGTLDRCNFYESIGYSKCDPIIVDPAQEWPTSMVYREGKQRILCHQSPPMAFLLLDSEKDEIIGHASAYLVPNRPTSLWFEGVLIAKDRRVRGLGKFLMSEMEKWMIENGFDEGFLSTEDQCKFYESIGYKKCDPIALYPDQTFDDDYKYQYLSKRIGLVYEQL